LHAAQVQHLEFNPVKTHQANRRAKPEITIRRLGDGIDAVGGQAIRPAPCLAIVLEQATCRIQGISDARQQKLERHRPRKQRASKPTLFRLAIQH
jgi:hypothetical protein